MLQIFVVFLKCTLERRLGYFQQLNVLSQLVGTVHSDGGQERHLFVNDCANVPQLMDKLNFNARGIL